MVLKKMFGPKRDQATGACSMRGREEKRLPNSGPKSEGKRLGVDGTIVGLLKWILKKYEGKVWTQFM
jgi:hypothetical protein